MTRHKNWCSCETGCSPRTRNQRLEVADAEDLIGAHWLHLRHFQRSQISISTAALLVTWGTRAFVSTKPTVWSHSTEALRQCRNVIQRAGNNEPLSLSFLWPMEQARSKKTLFLHQFMSQTTRGCKRSPFCYGISQALRTLAPSAAACPFPPTCPIKRRQPVL